MPEFIATYDLKETTPSPHSKFLENAVKNKWQLWILGQTNFLYRLPNTTLIGTFADRNTAVAALEKTRADTQRDLGRTVTMEKWIVSDHSSATFVSDQSKPNK